MVVVAEGCAINKTVFSAILVSIGLWGAHLGAGERSKPARLKGSVSPVVGAITSRALELDLDGDGKIDTWRKVDADGRFTEIASDGNGDGKPDQVVSYLDGRSVRTWDVNFDGAPDERFTEILDKNGNTVRSTFERSDRAGSWALIQEEETPPGARARKITRHVTGGKKAVSYDSLVVE